MQNEANIYLVKEVETINDIGEPVKTETQTKVRGKIESVSRNEWYSAQNDDMNAQYQITIYSFEFHNERIAILNGKRYSIYRTYQKDIDKIELYLGEKEGI